VVTSARTSVAVTKAADVQRKAKKLQVA
jgi:hypothetical protein